MGFKQKLRNRYYITASHVLNSCYRNRQHALAMALSDYFYEYVMIGTIDLAYPSNKRTFKHIAFEPDTPALIVRNVATGKVEYSLHGGTPEYVHLGAEVILWFLDHMMVPKQFERAADIQIAPIANWGRYYPKREVEVSVVNVMRNIIVDYWKHLGK